MGRVLLIAMGAAALAACGTPAGVDRDPHAGLSCAACHAGPQGERGRATVPAASCTASGCHDAGTPTRVRLATVTFPHRDHAANHEIDLTCAGCHTHDTGDAPLRASVEACALCHVANVSSSHAQECRLCHERPDHARLTSQGVAVSHSQLPWIEIGCVRCHYDVAEVETAVAPARCRGCHQDLAVLNRRAVGRDLHPIHDGVTCTACHVEGLHEVMAMSSTVELVCSDCHREAHGVEADRAEWPGRQLCGECHTGVHAAQQRLLLGISPDGTVMPSSKFVAGITCRSCHVPPPAGGRMGSDVAIRGQATACAGCHEREYAHVLDWWIEGSQTRLRASTRYVMQAASAVGPGSDSANSLLATAREMVGLVAAAGGHHNLELSDRLMRGAVTRALDAYAVVEMPAPAPPDLGRAPHSGMCSYCHYGSTGPQGWRSMPDAFHQRALLPRE